ncbi:LysR family transcriptional regulator [Acuticoccus kandeliae]|uniref:LysR family transcriptional regulator n=1 Tax=Acuticoccus kandeliae TaxID=2073160 RepID=UPI001475ED2D|nr:LysR family transcriptional regulator [Acuticoccus kandeliae]
MDIRLLRYFVAIAEAGSVSKAARHLGIAQPALSRHMKSLETMLHTLLLVRTSSGVIMTADGERFYAAALDILHRVDSIYDVTSARGGAITGRVVIGLPTSASVLLATPLVLAALEAYPRVQLHIIESLSGFLLEWVQTGRVDLAVLYDVKPTAALHVDVLLTEGLWLVGSEEMLAPHADGVTLAEVSRMPLVLPALPHSLRHLINDVAMRHGIALNIVAEIDSLHVAQKIAASGKAVAILTRSALHERLALGECTAVPIREPRIRRSVCLARPLTRASTRAAEEISKLCMSVTDKLVADGIWETEAPDRRPRTAAEPQ